MNRVKLAKWLMFLLASLYATLILLTFRDYGVTWDEPIQAAYGEAIIRWYRSGFRDDLAMSLANLHLYGGFFEVLGQLFARLSPLGMMESRHLLNAAFAFAGVLIAYRLGSRLGGSWVGVVGAALLLCTPAFYGDGFTNSKDIPFAVLYLLSLDYLVAVLEELPRPSRGILIRCGIAFGLAMGVRIGGILLFVMLSFAFGLWIIERKLRRDSHAFTPHLIKYPLTVGVVAWMAVLPWWPWAQLNPILHPLEAIVSSSRFPFTEEVFFAGARMPADELPWTYLPTWLLIRLPEFLLFGSVVGIFGFVAACRKFGFRDTFRADIGVVVLAVAFPICVAVAGRAVLYDGLRHFLFIIPPLAVLVAYSLSMVFRRLRSLPSRVVLPTIVLLLVGVTIWDAVRLHPYEYVYFNRAFGGGLPKAHLSFETDYYGASYKEGVDWLRRNVRPPGDGGSYVVASCSSPASTTYFLRGSHFRYAVLSGSATPSGMAFPEGLDFFLGTTRFNCHERFDGRIVHIVQRMGVPLLYVKARDGLAFD